MHIFYLTCGGVEEIRDILLGGGPISIPVCMLWTCSGPLRFYQIIEDSNWFSSENRHFDHSIRRRYALNWKNIREYSDVSRYSDPAIAGAGVCDKSKEVGDDPLTGDGVSGYGNKLQRDDYLSSRGETPKSEITLFRFVLEPTSVHFTVDEGVRTSYVNNPGCSSSSTEQSFPRTTADSSFERKEVLSGKQNFEQQLETGTSMVDKKFEDFQWDFSSQTGSTSCAPDGCFIDRLRCSSPGKINRSIMVISRKKMVYQRVGTTSSKASPPNISQESKHYFNSHANGEHNGF